MAHHTTLNVYFIFVWRIALRLNWILSDSRRVCLLLAVVLTSLLFFPLCCLAQSLPILHSEARELQLQNSQVFESAAMPTQAVVPSATKSRLQSAKEWGLTEAEWSRYEEVMAGPRGVWSPRLDPLTALGVEARSDAERRHFAELWVKMEYERTKRELAFELEHVYAQHRLYPDVKPVQYSPQARGKSSLGAAVSVGAKRILYFVYKDCVEACRVPLSNLIKAATSDSTTVLDVYVKGFDADDAALRGWAVKEQIPMQWVQAGRITLNHEGGALNRLQLGLENLPLTLLRTPDGKLTPFKG